MICQFCNAEIVNVHKNTKYCSAICKNKADYQRRKHKYSPGKRRKSYVKRCQQPEYRNKLRTQSKKQYQKVQEFLRQYKTQHGCADCGYKEHHAALEFDHILGTKDMSVCFAKSIIQAQKEIVKCEVVCSNCHKIRTFNRLQK